MYYVIDFLTVSVSVRLCPCKFVVLVLFRALFAEMCFKDNVLQKALNTLRVVCLEIDVLAIPRRHQHSDAPL